MNSTHHSFPEPLILQIIDAVQIGLENTMEVSAMQDLKLIQDTRSHRLTRERLRKEADLLAGALTALKAPMTTEPRRCLTCKAHLPDDWMFLYRCPKCSPTTES